VKPGEKCRKPEMGNRWIRALLANLKPSIAFVFKICNGMGRTIVYLDILRKEK
jgi:hypothetical protein